MQFLHATNSSVRVQNIEMGQFRWAHDGHLRGKLTTERTSGALHNSCSEKFGNFKGKY